MSPQLTVDWTYPGCCQRFARLTSAPSGKAENHAHAVNLNFFAHNLIRVHSTLTKGTGGRKLTPAMCARLAAKGWTVEEVVAAMDPKAVTAKKIQPLSRAAHLH